MKYPTNQYEILKKAFLQFFQSIPIEEVVNEIANVEQRVWWVYSRVTYDLQYDDSHPAYSAGQWEVNGKMEDRPAKARRVNYSKEFELYPAGCNDTHVWTAIHTISKEIGLA